MAELKDIIGYFCANYPNRGDLSDARLTKMVYLADWKSALDRKQQMTQIDWKFNHYGPYVEDVVRLALFDQDFNVEATNNMFGGYKKLISLKRDFAFTSITPEDETVLKHVIDTTSKLTWDSFIKLVYSTLPVVLSEKGSQLDLVSTARKYG